jgi:cytochrome c biogenesis protein CcdA
MIESFTPAGCGSRRRRRLALALFAAGAMLSAALLGALLGAAGALLPGGRAPLLAVAAVALAAAVREAGLLRLPLPQLRRQVPDGWRSSLPLPAWSFGYGAGLGAGMLTYQPVATFWVACAGAVAIGRPLVGAACLAFFGAGRALMVILPSRTDPSAAAARLAGYALAVRRVNAAALTALAALLLLVPVGEAEATTLQLGAGRQLDPSVSNGVLAYTQRSGNAVSVVVRPSNPVVFPGGESPALDGERLAYADREGIRVVHWPTGEELARAPGELGRPALQWPFLAFLAEDARGKRIVLSNLETGEFGVIAAVGRGGVLGRPALGGGRLAWHSGDGRSSRIVVMNLQTRRRTVVASSRIAALTHPALSGDSILYVESRSGRAQLLVRPVAGAASPRRLADVRARGTVLWTTALEGRTAFVTRWQQPTGRATLQRIRF